MHTRIDLRPLLADEDAAEMLMLARGQLNRAFTRHGRAAPDPVPHGPAQTADEGDRADPMRQGRARAMALFGPAFTDWCGSMPGELAAPLLLVLRQTQAALAAATPPNPAAWLAVMAAHRFLQPHADQVPTPDA